MRSLLALLFAVLSLGSVLLVWQDGRLPGAPSFAQDPAEVALRERAERLLEALQFKDFAEAARFARAGEAKEGDEAAQSAAAQRLVQRAFGIPPERLNMRNARLTRVTLDSEGRRGRTYLRFTQEDLNRAARGRERERRIEAVLYWRREDPAGRWRLLLDVSTR